jgi:ribosomal protein S18 acetylase RimI-like enzyme
MRIRPATIDDAHAIATLHVHSWQVGYHGIVPDDVLDALDPAARAADLRQRLSHRPEHDVVLVAETEEGVVGFVNAGPFRPNQARDSPYDLTQGEIRALYVSPAAWGTGAGYALTTAALRELSAQGRQPVRLWVLSANERARRFYERVGFVLDGEASVFRIERGGDPPVDLDEVRYVFDGRLG